MSDQDIIQLLVNYQEKLFWQCYRRTKDIVEAQDLLQDTNYNILKSVKDGKMREMEVNPSYFVKTASNILTDMRRKRNTSGKFSVVNRGEEENWYLMPATYPNYDSKQVTADIVADYCRLNGSEREVLKLRCEEDLTNEQIGKQLNRSLGYVKFKYSRTIRKMRDRLSLNDYELLSHK